MGEGEGHLLTRDINSGDAADVTYKYTTLMERAQLVNGRSVCLSIDLSKKSQRQLAVQLNAPRLVGTKNSSVVATLVSICAALFEMPIRTLHQDTEHCICSARTFRALTMYSVGNVTDPLVRTLSAALGA